jgi:hypothetical protein
MRRPRACTVAWAGWECRNPVSRPPDLRLMASPEPPPQNWLAQTMLPGRRATRRARRKLDLDTMMQSPPREDALGRWEGDGGTMPSPPREPRKREHAPCRPSLPPGYEAQPAWAFRDRTGRFFYEFNRVYGPPDSVEGRGPVCRPDEQLCYWSVIWSTFGEDGDEHPAGRWITYGQARKLPGREPTFERFASLPWMRDELPELLHVGDVSLKPHPTVVSLSSATELSRRHGDLETPGLQAQVRRSVPAPRRSEVTAT